MRFTDSFRMAAGGLSERKMRTALTIVGIVIGSSMIVALYASTAGQSAAIEEQLGKLGPTTLIVRAGEGARFTSADVEKVLVLDGVQTAFLTVSGNVQATRAGLAGSASILGVSPQDVSTLVRGLSIAEGDLYEEGDGTSAFLGANVAAPDPQNGTFVYTGDTISVVAPAGHGSPSLSRTLVVSGVAATFGSAPFVNVDDTVFVDIKTAQQLARLNTGQYNQLIVIASDPALVPQVQADVRATLGTNVVVLSGTQLASTVSGIFSSIGTLLGSIAAISLLVAGVGIANTMFVSVLERVTEIGTLKALGFKARQVLGVFLLEASLTGLAGGILGSLLGVGVAFGIGSFIRAGLGRGNAAAAAPAGEIGERGGFVGGRGGFGGAGHGPGGEGFGGGGGATSNAFNFTAEPLFSVKLFAFAILFAVVIAVVAGLLPSRKAAKLDPVVALKRL